MCTKGRQIEKGQAGHVSRRLHPNVLQTGFSRRQENVDRQDTASVGNFFSSDRSQPRSPGSRRKPIAALVKEGAVVQTEVQKDAGRSGTRPYSGYRLAEPNPNEDAECEEADGDDDVA